jgi:hypothetical protein
MADLFKFRCFQCESLIGAPASRRGKVANCPTCGVELIVPSPDSASAATEEPDPDAFRPEALGLDLATGRISPSRVAPAPGREPVGPDPIAFLERAAETEDQDEPESRGDVPDQADDNPLLPEPATEPLVGRRQGRRHSRRTEPSLRARDVVFPRTAAIAWAMFAILALAFAFATGLFVGHFVWK